MRPSLTTVFLIVAAPALAQTGPPLVSSAPYNAGSNDNARFVSNGAEPVGPRDVPVATVLRAGAWGRCVAAASPELSRAYVTTKAADPALKPVFNVCLRRSGDFFGSNWGEVRRAALTDALAPPR